jgi:uncharacterized protein (DUF433 family)
MKSVKTLKPPHKKSRIVRDPQILGGKPVIAGTRIPVRLILDHLAEGYMPEEIIFEYPTLTLTDIQAAKRLASRAVDRKENNLHVTQPLHLRRRAFRSSLPAHLNPSGF